MLIRTNPPTSKTLWLSLITFMAGAGMWYFATDLIQYALIAMVIGYIILLSGTIFKGI